MGVRVPVHVGVRWSPPSARFSLFESIQIGIAPKPFLTQKPRRFKNSPCSRFATSRAELAKFPTWYTVHGPWYISHGPWSTPKPFLTKKTHRFKNSPCFRFATSRAELAKFPTWYMVHGPWYIPHGPSSQCVCPGIAPQKSNHPLLAGKGWLLTRWGTRTPTDFSIRSLV